MSALPAENVRPVPVYPLFTRSNCPAILSPTMQI